MKNSILIVVSQMHKLQNIKIVGIDSQTHTDTNHFFHLANVLQINRTQWTLTLTYEHEWTKNSPNRRWASIIISFFFVFKQIYHYDLDLFVAAKILCRDHWSFHLFYRMEINGRQMLRYSVVVVVIVRIKPALNLIATDPSIGQH